MILIGTIVIIAVELVLIVLIKSLRRNFQWLITEEDEIIRWSPEILDKFFAKSFDPELGWCRRPNTTGHEKGAAKDIIYHIGSLGERMYDLHSASSSLVASFGDSFTFGRQVEDNETWQYFLAQKINTHVLNFGVGNYGFDQALLRYERTDLPRTVQTVIMGFVPETICRIQSYWKHYLEFGNTLAFKPRFELKDNQLQLIPQAMKKRGDFENLCSRLHDIQSHDRYYLEKFKKLQFRFPYTLSLLRHPARQSGLIKALLGYSAKDQKIRKAFELVMQYNILQSHYHYCDDSSTTLFEALINRFKMTALKRGHKPILLIMPQLTDLKTQKSLIYYQDFYKSIAKDIQVIDLTNTLMRHAVDQSIYIEDGTGGHFSPEGNRLIAECLLNAMENL